MASRAESVTDEKRSYDASSRADLVLRFLVPVTEVRGHLVERHGHRDRFGAAADRDLSLPIAGGDIVCGGGDVLERARHPPAEGNAGRDGEKEDHAAGAQELVAQLIEESLRRLPILQQEHPVCAAGRRIRRQGKGARHVTAAGDRLTVEGKAG